MKPSFIIIFITISLQCFPQNDYGSKLKLRVDEIKRSTYFSNTTVIIGRAIPYDPNAYPDLMCGSFPQWSPTLIFYLNDVAILNGKVFEAQADSLVDKNPETSPNDWKMIDDGSHPYEFLRDTASIEDLKKLVISDNPYLKLYSFCALAHRNHSDVYQIVIDNLTDTTRIEQMTGDVGSFELPVDLMLEHSIEKLSKDERETIKNLILKRYPHLKSLKNFKSL